MRTTITGRHSRIALDRTEEVVSGDVDHGCIVADSNYGESREFCYGLVQPIDVDELVKPTERSSACMSDRGTFLRRE
jgi:hypothetical protein